jgi:hypothetical protein
MRRIISQETYNKGLCRQSIQDGNRKFITLVACVSALRQKIAPVLLYKGQSKDIQDSWVSKLKEDKDVFFGITPNGWTNNAYGIKWLQEVFKP